MVPSRPRSLPERTRTLSPTLNLFISDYLPSQGRNFCIARFTNFTRYRPEHPGPPREPLLVNNHRGVIVKADVAAVGPPYLFSGTHDNCAHQLLIRNRAVWVCPMDRTLYHLANCCGFADSA